MERIEPQKDHEQLSLFQIGQRVNFEGKSYVIQAQTTLASGEAAVVLQGEKDQFVMSASAFLARAK
jgi:hypothetical protein